MSNYKENTCGLAASHITFALLFLFFISCNSVNNHPPAKDKATAGLIVLPEPKPIVASEQQRLHDSCQRWYDSLLKRSNFNGGMLVAKDGNIIFEQYNGTVPLTGGDSINASTVFHIASVSKTFTAMTVLKLAEEGKLNIRDDFQKYFPAFDYPGVTIQTLLNHRSGLPNYLYFVEDLNWNKNVPLTNQDVLDILITRKAELKDITRPNTHFTYCNTNYALLALLIEKVTGKTYPAYLKETIFDPLAMTHSFVFTPADSTRITPNYDWRGTEIKANFLDNTYGDKNIYTSPRDLLQWHRALQHNLFLNSNSLSQAYAPYSNEHPGVKNYGLGWRMNIYPNGQKVIFHNGWWHGNNAAFVRLLDQDIVIIVLGDKYNRGIYKMYHLINAFDNYSGQVEIEE